MIKIIDLDIEGSLTGDTRVEEIALVQMPAIEQNFIYFTQQDFVDSITDYPQYITDTAIRAKKWVDENGYGSCMTPVGKQRLNQLANREPLSLLTLKRMKAFGSRHKKDWEASKSFEDGCGYLALASWGFEPSTYEQVMNYLDRVITREEMATVGPRGGINPSKKAPKSTTPNKDPKGEGSAKGDASSTRGAEVSKAVEEILQKKSDDFNEKYKDKLGYGVNLGMLKSVYQRGVGAYNTSHSPAVKSSQQWALARVNAFLYLVKNGCTFVNPPLPVVEYRLCAIATVPCNLFVKISESENTSSTRPSPLWTANLYGSSSPFFLAATIPAASCPLCCNACKA